MFIQIATGSYTFINKDTTEQSHCIYALDECGVVYKYILNINKWVPLEEVNTYREKIHEKTNREKIHEKIKFF